MYRTAPKERTVEVTVKLTRAEVRQAMYDLLKKKYPNLPDFASVTMGYNTINTNSMINWETDKDNPIFFSWVEKN